MLFSASEPFCGATSEVEARVCMVHGPQRHKLVSNVGVHEFYGVKERFESIFADCDRDDYDEVITIYVNGVRHIKRSTPSSTVSRFERKTPIGRPVVRDVTTRIPSVSVKWAHSKEEVVDADDAVNVDVACIRRKKVCRIRFATRWDMYFTVVTDILSGNKTHEMEMEYIYKTDPPSPHEMRSIERMVGQLFSHCPERDVIRSLNTLVTGRRSAGNYLAWNTIINKPVNLKRDTCVCNYGFRIKMDGVRYLLYARKGHLYALNDTHPIMMFRNTNVPSGTVLDAEYVSALSAPLYIFDVLFHKGVDVRMQTAMERDILLSNMPLDRNMHVMRLETDLKMMPTRLLDPNTDGMVLFPLDKPYRNTCTYKYKPPDMMTLDFLVRPNGNVATLNVVDMDGKYVVFKGTDVYPCDGSVDNLDDDEYADTITEFSYNASTGVFVPVRIRHDKCKPNFIGVAKDVWQDIHEPIDISEFVKKITAYPEK